MQIRETTTSKNTSSGHKNAFSGLCIHGKDGAKLIAGRLINPECDKCQQMQGGQR